MNWFDLAAGKECPHCAPRPVSTEYMDFIAQLSTSSLYLAKNQTWRGTCALIFDPRHATEPSQLSTTEWQTFTADVYLAQQAITSVVQPDHLNIALLGNTIPHLHWGIIPRYQHDPKWGTSIWEGSRVDRPDVRLNANQQNELVQRLRTALNHSTNS